MAFSQNFEARDRDCIMQFSISFKDLYFHSTTLFCWVYGILHYNSMPLEAQKYSNLFSHTPPIVYTHNFNILLRLFLSECFEALKVLKELFLFLKKVYLGIPWVIINEVQGICGSTNWRMNKWTHQININKLRNLCISPCFSFVTFLL
jgi:hypothetical protein